MGEMASASTIREVGDTEMLSNPIVWGTLLAVLAWSLPAIAAERPPTIFVVSHARLRLDHHSTYF